MIGRTNLKLKDLIKIKPKYRNNCFYKTIKDTFLANTKLKIKFKQI